MFDSKCNQKEFNNRGKGRIINIANILIQTCMTSLLIYISYKLIYRPFVLGVDILSYTLIDVGLACLMYMLFNRGFLLLHDMYCKLSTGRMVVENLIIYTLNLLLAYKTGYSLYYSRSCFILVCTLLFVNLGLSYLSIKKRQLSE